MGNGGTLWGRSKSGKDLRVAAKEFQERRSNHYRYAANRSSGGDILKVNVGLCVAILAAHVGTRARLVPGGHVLYSPDIYTTMTKVYCT